MDDDYKCDWDEVMKTMQLLIGAEYDGNVTIQYCHMTYKCLNRAHRSRDKPLKAKVFFILYPSRAAQLQFTTPKFFESM